MSQLEAALRAVAEAVNEKLSEVLPTPAGVEDRVLEAMRYATLAGGKRLRPFLVVSSADLFGVPREASLAVGAAVELVHTYSLVHDDLPCMDDDDLRRGMPTVHVKYDEATAVLAGDGLLTHAFGVLADESIHSDAEVRCELVGRLAWAAGCEGMVGGQMIDLLGENQRLDLEATKRLQQMKTGAIFTFSCEAGAILGRASAEARAALRTYAADLGLAFQIADDLLDAEGKSENLGKAVGKDAAAGKATFVSILGVEGARAEAERLADEAAARLDMFAEKADILRATLKFVINRQT